MRVRKFSKGMTQRLGPRRGPRPRPGRPAARRADRRSGSGRPPRDPRPAAGGGRPAGRAILLNSHLLSEVEQDCGRVAVLRQGSVVAEGRIEDLTPQASRYRLVASRRGRCSRSAASAKPAPPSSASTATSTSPPATSTTLNALVDRLRVERREPAGALAGALEPRGRLRRTSCARIRPGRESRHEGPHRERRGGLPRGGGALDADRVLRALLALHPPFRARGEPRHRRRRAGRREALRESVEMGAGRVVRSTGSCSASNRASRVSSTSSGHFSLFLRPRTWCRACRRRGRSTSTCRARSGASAPPVALRGRPAPGRRQPRLSDSLDVGDHRLEDPRTIPRFLLGGTVILFTIAALMAFAFLVGVVTSSTGVSLMATYAVFFFAAMLAAHDRIAAAVSTERPARIVQGLYWTLPKTAELCRASVALVAGGAGHRTVRGDQRARRLRFLVPVWHCVPRSGGLVVFQKGFLR